VIGILERLDAEDHGGSERRDGHQEIPGIYPGVDRGRTDMSIQTKMAIEQSRPMPQCSESGVSVRYETSVFSLWDRKALAEVAHACMYEISWIPERQCWRSFLCSVSKVG